MKKVWYLTAPDSKRIRCMCGHMAIYGRTSNGSAPFFYECESCLPVDIIPTTERVRNHPIKVYDNEKTNRQTIDRYTVVFMDQKEGRNRFGNQRLYACLGMNGAPFHPQGFCQHSSAVVGKHLGKRIRFSALPIDCQKAVMNEWGE